jgi:hypothetical protein
MRVRRMERQFSGWNSLQHDMHEKLDSFIFGQQSHCGQISQPSVHSSSFISVPSGSNSSHVNPTSNPVSQSLPNLVPSLSSTSLTDIDPAEIVTVQLADGPFLFHKSKAHPPPAQRFSRDIPNLFREWEVSNLLQIDGKGIPVKDWDKIYKKKVGLFLQAWKAIRVQWGNWKVCTVNRIWPWDIDCIDFQVHRW